MERFTRDLQILSASRALKIEAIDAYCHYNGSCVGCPFDDDFNEEEDSEGCTAPVFWDGVEDKEVDEIIQDLIDSGVMLENGRWVKFSEDDVDNIYDDINRELDSIDELSREVNRINEDLGS